jgi:hypothetical protein
MPYDPRQLQQIQQLGRMGVGMMGPQGSPFDRTARPPQWWEQPLPGRSGGGAISPARKDMAVHRENTCAWLRVARGQYRGRAGRGSQMHPRDV